MNRRLEKLGDCVEKLLAKGVDLEDYEIMTIAYELLEIKMQLLAQEKEQSLKEKQMNMNPNSLNSLVNEEVNQTR